LTYKPYKFHNIGYLCVKVGYPNNIHVEEVEEPTRGTQVVPALDFDTELSEVIPIYPASSRQ
jgi:hypothetical protein